MLRRETPYSRLAEIRANRSELVALVLATLALGVALSLVSDALYTALDPGGDNWPWILGLGLALSLGLTLALAWLFYSQTESRVVQIETWLPYHLPDARRVTIARQPTYRVTQFARQAWVRHYRPNTPAAQDWLARWRKAKEQGTPFQTFALADHVALSQCLLLYALHRAGEEILGAEAGFGWCGVDLPAVRLPLDALPPPLRDNPFLRADQSAKDWRLLLPQDVTLSLALDPGQVWPRWRLRHPRYGEIDLSWKPQVAVAGRGSQVWRVLTQNLRLSQRSQLYVLNARLQARARFRWTLLPGSDPFHRWATHTLARLEEALDWAYFLETRPARILADLDWKIGWWEQDDSLVDALARIESRLADLELSLEPQETSTGAKDNE